jgi:HSP20 family protein
MSQARELEVVSSSPFAELSELGSVSRYVDELLHEMLGRWDGAPRAIRPRVDVVESNGSYVITAEVPGMRKDDLTVECQNGVLTIRGEKRTQREGKTERPRLLERGAGTFTRSLVLPSDADSAKIDARCEDGVLRVEIDKRPEAKPKLIAIKG